MTLQNAGDGTRLLDQKSLVPKSGTLAGAVMYGGFQGALIWAPLMPRDASLSDSYKSVGGGFPV